MKEREEGRGEKRGGEGEKGTRSGIMKVWSEGKQ